MLSRGHTQAILGAIVWVAGVSWMRPGLLDTEWAEALFLLAPLVLVPLGLDLVRPAAAHRLQTRVWSLCVIAQLPAALLLCLAYFSSPGVVAAALSVPWLTVAAAIAPVDAGRGRDGAGSGRRVAVTAGGRHHDADTDKTVVVRACDAQATETGGECAEPVEAQDGIGSAHAGETETRFHETANKQD